MDAISVDPAAAIPDADVLEQQLAATAAPLTQAEHEQHAVLSAPLGADEADVYEQLMQLPVDDDEEYLPNPGATGAAPSRCLGRSMAQRRRSGAPAG
jgi:hypothetical protein